MTSIKRKTVLVTGGANGIGKLIGEKCLQKGAEQLIIWDINEQLLEETLSEFTQKGYKVHGYVVDVSQPKDIEASAEDILAEIGTVDILFNNAGIVVGKKFAEHAAKDIDNTININVLGVMHTARVFLPAMLKQHQGHIVNIASATGFVPNPNMSVYVSSKWAVLGWSESLRVEMDMQQTHVHVTTVCPSYINTGMFDGAKAPLLTPILEPDYIANKIIEGVEKNKALVTEPSTVKLVPFFRSILPTNLFDSFVGGFFGMYKSMEEFKGRTATAPQKDSAKTIKS
ncbi:MAG: SDR family oxidoreductase [Chitinophagales bacterium]|jgi:short-subunit dehydrogenase|nr:SDR family oxidoreductase [Chitinophagales bacterium]